MTIVTTVFASDSGAVVRTALRRNVCTYFGSLHPILKGEQYVGFVTWAHRPKDRLCLACARRADLIREVTDQ